MVAGSHIVARKIQGLEAGQILPTLLERSDTPKIWEQRSAKKGTDLMIARNEQNLYMTQVGKLDSNRSKVEKPLACEVWEAGQASILS